MRSHAKASSVGTTAHWAGARGRSILLTLGIAVVSLLAFAPGAFAAKGVVDFFGAANTGAAEGQFSFQGGGPSGIAVNQAGTDATGGNGASAGDVYVVDRGNNRVQQFDAAGTFIRTFGADVGGSGVDVCTSSCVAGTATSEAGGMDDPRGVAIDQATGLVYVTDQSNRRVDVFSAGGAFQGAFGWGALDGTAAFQFCTTSCSAPNTDAPTDGDAGKFGEAIGLPAVSPSGEIYVADRANLRVDVFTPTISSGVVTAVDFDQAFGWGVDTGADAFETCTVASTCQQGLSSSSSGGFGEAGPTSLAIDSAGNSYVIDFLNNRVEKFDSSNQPLGVFAESDLSGSEFPVDIAADRSNNHVFIVKPCDSTICPAAPFENRVLEFDSAGTLIDTHAANAGLNSVNAIAVSQSNGNIYVGGGTGGLGVFILNTIVPPLATVDPGSGFTHDANSATFTGTVNPTGYATKWHFEYSTDGSNWTSIPAEDVTLPFTDSSAHAVSQAVTGLIGSTLYHVRLLATKPFGAGTSTSVETTFTTNPGLPLISGELASDVTETAATLSGEVNPDNLATTWRFEYTDDADFQSNGFANADLAPVPNAAIPSGITPVAVGQPISGLEPNTLYHFRLVATNATGTAPGPGATFSTYPEQGSQSCPNDQFRTGVAAHLPDCRAYEQVTPVDKANQNMPYVVTSSGSVYMPQVSADGDRASFWSYGAPDSPAPSPFILSSRESEDWASEATLTSQSVAKGILCFIGYLAYSDDLSRGVMTDGSPGLGCGADDPPIVPDEPRGVGNLFVRDNTNGTFQLVSLPPVSGVAKDATFEGGSSDLSHVVFSEAAQLTADATAGSMLYKWTEGNVSLVSTIPTSPATTCSAAACTAVADAILGSAAGFQETQTVARAISADGARTFFRVNGNLYVHDGNTTTQVDASQGPGASGGGVFATAESATGSSVIFTATSKLTSNSTATAGHPELYRYDVGSNTLTDLTVNSSEANGADVLGLLGASEDLSYLYFAAKGVLTATPNSQGDTAVAGQPNLYLRHGGVTTFLGTLADGDMTNWGAGNQTGQQARPWSSRVTPDGRHLAFETTESLTGYNNNASNPADCRGLAGPSLGACAELFLYDADANQLHCVSCNLNGLRPVGESRIARAKNQVVFWAGPERNNFSLQRNLSEDGTRMFFESTDALLPTDTNGKQDVYEWEATGTGGCEETTVAGGCIYLLSSGQSDGDSYFFDASANGDDAMIVTYERFAGRDTDLFRDLYDARVGGGLASQYPTPTTSCDPSSGACEGTGSTAPAQAGAGSAALSGPGDPKPRAHKAKKKKKHAKRRHKARKHHSKRSGNAKHRSAK